MSNKENQTKVSGASNDEPSEETDFAKEPLSEKIGDSLRKIYKDLVEEPVPDEFLDILKRTDG